MAFSSGQAGTGSTSEELEPLIPDNVDIDITGVWRNKIASVEFLDLHPGRVFYKRQYKYNNTTTQRVIKEQGMVRMIARTNCQLLRIFGWVKRAVPREVADRIKDMNGDVPIRNEDTGMQLNLIQDIDINSITADGGCTLVPFSVNLHDIYKGNPGAGPVFELHKSDPDRKINVFQLIIQLEFIDKSRSQKFPSPSFNLRTEVREDGTKKRKYGQEENTAASPGGSMDSGVFDGDGRRREIIVDTLNARTAVIDKLVAHNLRVETQRADLAYHLSLKEPDKYSDMEEGDIVGFYKDAESGDTYIEPLRGDNIHDALHAGVVSRSYWLAGHKPANADAKTDTICVIGIVNVKVVGSIENGERIYASTAHPGTAIPQSRMPVGSFLRKKQVLLGMALETKKTTKTLDEVNLVKCFVCIVLDVSRKELLDEIEDMYAVNEKRTEEQIKFQTKKTWRRLKCYVLAFFILLGGVIFFLYQWLVPGSMFRYWLCRRGSIPDHDLYFHYTDTNIKRHFRVHGIQFTRKRLEDKVHISFAKNRHGNGSSVLYYLNVDRCAYYWADGAAGNNIGGRKYIGGARVLSVINPPCSVVYDLVEQDDYWEPVENQTRVRCEQNL